MSSNYTDPHIDRDFQAICQDSCEDHANRPHRYLNLPFFSPPGTPIEPQEQGLPFSLPFTPVDAFFAAIPSTTGFGDPINEAPYTAALINSHVQPAASTQVPSPSAQVDLESIQVTLKASESSAASNEAQVVSEDSGSSKDVIDTTSEQIECYPTPLEERMRLPSGKEFEKEQTVVLWNYIEERKVAGRAAPFFKNL